MFPNDRFRGPRGPRGPRGLRGPEGPPGSGGGGGDAAQWFDGAGAPSGALGDNGDYYLRTSNGDVYTKAAGAWSVTGNIKGPAGDAGADGDDGAAGADGSVWRDGAGAPAGGLGVDGDYYLRTSNGDVYFKAAGAYSVVGNIKGPQGDPGADGSDGADGADGEGFPGGPAPAFPALTPAIYERWIFDVPNITLVDGRVSVVTGVVNGRTFTQGTAANRPRFYPRHFNGGFGCVHFNGTSHRMIHVPASTKAIPFTIVAVMEDYLGGTGNQNLVNTGSIIWFRSGGNWVCYAGTVAQHTTSGALATTAPLLNGATNHPVAGIEVFNGAASVVNAYGTEQTVSSGAAANALTNAVNVVLCDDGAGTGWARAKIRELLFLEGALSIGERASLLTYYSHPLIAGIPTPI